MKIRIIKTPPGNYAPEDIRERWVGMEFAAEKDDPESGECWDSSANAGGYIVQTSDAIKALEEANESRAADFWAEAERVDGIDKLRFGPDCCEAV